MQDADAVRAAVHGADAVVYLVGTFGKDQQQLHATSAGVAAQAATAGGAQAFVYLSSLAADALSDGTYASTKAQGEQLGARRFPACDNGEAVDCLRAG